MLQAPAGLALHRNICGLGADAGSADDNPWNLEREDRPRGSGVLMLPFLVCEGRAATPTFCIDRTTLANGYCWHARNDLS